MGLRDAGETGIRIAAETVLNPVQQKRQNDRNRKSPQQAVHAQLQCIDQVSHKVRGGQKPRKMLESHPLASGDAFERIVILKSDQYTAHGRVLENHCQ